MDFERAVSDVDAVVRSMQHDIESIQRARESAASVRSEEIAAAEEKIAAEERTVRLIEARKVLVQLLREYTLEGRAVSDADVDNGGTFISSIDAIVRAHITHATNTGDEDAPLKKVLSERDPTEDDGSADDTLHLTKWAILYAYGSAFLNDLNRSPEESAHRGPPVIRHIDSRAELQWNASNSSDRSLVIRLLMRCADTYSAVLQYAIEHVIPALVVDTASPESTLLFSEFAAAVRASKGIDALSELRVLLPSSFRGDSFDG